ncbi:hypothetical protein M758_7G128600 [Ceratodon purpureus]|nr:hypothetical protein M758_7G128600 [Ceratodon purpureus]
MSYHELPRRELQARCKEYGLPANKSNAVMASSLTSFLGDPRTNVLLRAPQVVFPVAKKSMIKARLVPKPERLETSLASLILQATESRAKVLKSKPRELCSEGRKLPDSANLPAFTVSSPGKRVESVPQPKTAPLLRRKKKNTDATQSTDPSNNLSPLHEEISMQDSETMVKKLSTLESLIAPVPDAAVLGTFDEGSIESEPLASPPATVLPDQGCQQNNNERCEEPVRPSLRPLIFRITANVDRLIRQTTTILKQFEEWKDVDKLPSALETH